jgi:hypothetical protein
MKILSYIIVEIFISENLCHHKFHKIQIYSFIQPFYEEETFNRQKVSMKLFFTHYILLKH